MAFIGLNTTNSLSDINNKQTALRNLGINLDDLEVIRGLDQSINKQELQLASNLDVDQKAELFSLSSSISAIENEIKEIRDVRFTQQYNFNINNQIRARAIKYSFLEKNQDGKANKTAEPRSADISTSRVSSWSSTVTPAQPTDPIFYGGDLDITGDLETQSIQILSQPEARQYSAELPTHLVTIRINGEDKQFYAMKGIPLRFRGFFRNANLFHKVIEIANVNPVWKILNVDITGEFEGTLSYEDEYNFQDRFSRLRDIEFYYDPRSILELNLSGLLLEQVTTTRMENLDVYDLSQNNLVDTPDFNFLTPSLVNLNLRGNNLSRSTANANVQLQRLPSSLQSLNVSGCFREDTELDLSHLSNLTSLIVDSYYRSRGRRSFIGSLNSPKVGSLIETYNIQNQGAFRTLDSSIESAPNLKVLDIDRCNIASNLNGDDITISSQVLERFSSSYNSHNLIDVSNQVSLRSYSYRYSSIGASRDNNIENKFTGCVSLESINLYRTNVTGSVTSVFQGLTELEYLDLRRTGVFGTFDASSFAGTEKIQYLYIEGGQFNGPLFSGNPLNNLSDLRRIIIQNNRNITGSLPDFSRNTRLDRIYIRNTGITGSPNFTQNRNLRYVYMDRNELSGEAPALQNNQLITAVFSDNNFTGELPILSAFNLRTLDFRDNQLNGVIPSFRSCPRLQSLRLSNNNLEGYTAGNIDEGGALAECGNLSNLDLSNNDLKNEDAFAIIRDMYKTYQINPRRRVTINFLGNSKIDENQIQENDSVRPLLEFLRNKGWTILI